MTIKQFFRFIIKPYKFVEYYHLRLDKIDRVKTLVRVTRLESVQDLHDKIRVIDNKIANL